MGATTRGPDVDIPVETGTPPNCQRHGTIAGVPAFDDIVRKFLTRRRPGWLLKAIAGVPVPVMRAEAFAAREPEGDRVNGVSPLVEPLPVPRRAQAHAGRPILDGDVVIKDQIDVAGSPTGVGCATNGAAVEKDAEVVARIVAAGGRIIGKAKMTELGIDGLGVVMHYATPENPRAPGYSPGGSSTGSRWRRGSRATASAGTGSAASGSRRRSAGCTA
jgi:Asp-tRNA(Asn)/Glu-tRNA(Gln) amidotransferase A subunit family amidase